MYTAFLLCLCADFSLPSYFLLSPLADTIRYLSLHDNKYLRYFKGHKSRVTSLCMSPEDDTFMSASEDKTVRLWDLRSTNAQVCHRDGAARRTFWGLIVSDHLPGAGVDPLLYRAFCMLRPHPPAPTIQKGLFLLSGMVAILSSCMMSAPTIR